MQEVARGQPNGLAAFDNGADDVGCQEGIADCLAHAVRWDGVFGGNLLEVLSRVVDPLSDSGGAPLQVFFDSVDEFPSLHQASYESGCFNSSPPKAGHVE